MIVLAVLLLIGSGGFAAALVISNLSASNQAIQVAGSNIFHWGVSGIFLAGMVVAGAFGLGLYLLVAGSRHRLRVASRYVAQRREVRALRNEQETKAVVVEDDRTRLTEELESERAEHKEDLRKAAAPTRRRRTVKAPATTGGTS
jgi:lipopolysaccharide export LptBFGC system permease protein LptF